MIRKCQHIINSMGVTTLEQKQWRTWPTGRVAARLQQLMQARALRREKRREISQPENEGDAAAEADMIEEFGCLGVENVDMDDNELDQASQVEGNDTEMIVDE